MAHAHSPAAGWSRNYSIGRHGSIGPRARSPWLMAARALLRHAARMLHKGAAQIPASRAPLVHEPGAGEIAVQFLSSADDLARLAPEWNRLHGAAVAASV